MFRRATSSLPKDPQFPHNLEQLGYFINDDDEIKSIANPTQDYRYFINKNERYNEMQKEAFNICIRREVLSRLAALSVPITRLPLNAAPTEPHIPILTSNNLSSPSRVLLVFGEQSQDLGIWAYRCFSSSRWGGSFTQGSAIGLVQRLAGYASSATDPTPPGLVIANLGQTVWWRGGKQAVGYTTWTCLPRKSAVHGPMRLDSVKNRVKGLETAEKQVAYIFEEVVGKLVRADAKIDIIGLSHGALAMMQYLNEHWKLWAPRISAIALGNPMYQVPGPDIRHMNSDVTDPNLVQFLKERSRAYVCSVEPIGALVQDQWMNVGCPIFSAGDEGFTELIMPRAVGFMLDYLDDVTIKGPQLVTGHTPEAAGEEGAPTLGRNGEDLHEDVNRGYKEGNAGEGEVLDGLAEGIDKIDLADWDRVS